jgi:hypothetical protein
MFILNLSIMQSGYKNNAHYMKNISALKRMVVTMVEVVVIMKKTLITQAHHFWPSINTA